MACGPAGEHGGNCAGKHQNGRMCSRERFRGWKDGVGTATLLCVTGDGDTHTHPALCHW